MTAAVELAAVSLIRDGAAIVREIDLAVEYGRVLALVGPNGAGKSSLLAIMARDVAPTHGAVRIDGRPVAEYRSVELSRRRSVLLQSNEVAFGFTVADVVEMGRAPWPRDDDEQAVIASALRRADVEHLVDRRFATLSGGERARTSLARVLAQNADVVLLDEPTAALDLGHQEGVLRIARDLAGEGRAVVVVLHDLSLAAAYADEVAMMADGRLVARGTPHETLTAARVEAVYGTPVRVLADPDTGRPIVIPRRSL